MDNWNVLAAQTSSQAIGRDDLNAVVKTRLVSTAEKAPSQITCSKQNKNENDCVECEAYSLYTIYDIFRLYTCWECLDPGIYMYTGQPNSCLAGPEFFALLTTKRQRHALEILGILLFWLL